MATSSYETLHACAVAWGKRGLLITGPSGSGKSGLTLQLMALGCRLIADDRTQVSLRDGQLIAQCSEAIIGKIEARGLGILRADPISEAAICAIVDLGQTELKRIPDCRFREIQTVKLRLFHNCANEVFPFALLQYLKCGLDEESPADE